MKLPATLKPEEITAVSDQQEEIPFDLSPLQTVRAHLTTGDYSVVGLEHVISIERKSLTDLLKCVGKDRARFEREVQRMLAYPVRALVVEATWLEIELGGWRSKVTPSQAMGSLLGWMCCGIPVLMGESHKNAGRYVARMLLISARRRWREARGFAATVKGGE